MNYEIGEFSERWRGDRIVKKWNLFLKFISQQPPDFAIQFHLSGRSKKRRGGRQTRYITSEPVHVWSNNQWKGGKHAGLCFFLSGCKSQRRCFYSAASLNQQIHFYTTTQTKAASICPSYLLLIKLSKTSFHRQLLFLFTKTHISTRFQSCWIIKYL